MLAFVQTLLLVLATAVLPTVWVGSWLYQRRFENVLLRWKMTGVVYVTLVCFVVSLTSFLLACFFFAAYLGHIEGIQLIDVRSSVLLSLGIDCMALLWAALLTFVIARNLFTQVITREGIVLHRLPNDLFQLKPPVVIAWADIADYYQHSDYPITRFHFILRTPEGTFRRAELRVPFYVLATFEHWLERSLQRHTEPRDTPHRPVKRSSRAED